MYKLIITILMVFVITSVFALKSDQLEVRSLPEGATSPIAKISDLAWLVGRWTGEGLGGSAEEVIAPPVDGQMMGMFRHANKEGKISFYEFYLFSEIEESLVLRIKHFGNDLHGWEEKDEFVEFPLVAIEEQAVYFDGLSYALSDTNTLLSAVRVDAQGIISFKFSRDQLSSDQLSSDQLSSDQ